MTLQRTARSFLAAGVLACVIAPVAEAQVSLTRPPRVARPQRTGNANPNRTHQELTSTVNLLGGYDDDLTSLNNGGGRLPVPGTTVPTTDVLSGMGDAAIQYYVGKNSRSLTADGRAFGSAYQSMPQGVLYGGEASISGQTSLGRRMTLNGSERYRNDPFFGLGGFSTLPPGTPNNPGNNPNYGLTANRSWTTDTSVSLRRDWTTRMNTDVGYSYRQRTYPNGLGFDSTQQSATLAFDRSVRRTAGVTADYSYSSHDYMLATGGTRWMKTQSAQLGFRTEIVRSRTRSISMNAGGGAMFTKGLNAITSQPYDSLSPSGHASINADLGRTWNVGASYHRTMSVLQGQVPVTYITQVTNVNGGGFLNRWLESVAAFGYSNGHAPDTPLGAIPHAAYKIYTASGQLRFHLSDTWSALLLYSHYRHRLDSPSQILYGINSEIHRNSVRVGFGWTLPIIQ